MQLLASTNNAGSKKCDILTTEECRLSVVKDLEELEINQSNGTTNTDPEYYDGQTSVEENDPYMPPMPVITIVVQILSDKDASRDNTSNLRQEVLPTEMTSAWRVLSFFFVIFVLPTILISVPLYARYKLYSAKTHFFTNGDMYSLHNDVSSFWCQGQKVISNGTFEAFLTPEPKRLKRRRRRMKVSSEVLLMQDDVEEWGFYLVKGSKFSFSSCSRWPGGTLLVVKGVENLRRCFYREERFAQELMQDSHPKPMVLQKESEPQYKLETNIEENPEEGGGEVFDQEGDSDFLDIDSLQQLHSSNKDGSVKNAFDEQKIAVTKYKSFSKEKFTTEFVTQLDEDIITTTDLPQNTEDVTRDSLNLRAPMALKLQSEATKTKLTDAMKHMVSVSVNKGSFFYNENDTLDVTTGNSSYSSSEEFLAQCSDTIKTVELSPYIDCKSQLDANGSENTWRFAVNDSDFYYFIFFSDNSIEANVISFRLQINRTLYDISEDAYSQKCSNSSKCIFPFSFMKSAAVIVDYGSNKTITKLEQLEIYQLTSICQPRSIVYTVFILLVPFIIFLFAFR